MHVSIPFYRSHRLLRQWTQIIRHIHLASIPCKDVKTANLPVTTKKQSKSAGPRAAATVVVQRVQAPKSTLKSNKKETKKLKDDDTLGDGPVPFHPLVDKGQVLPGELLGIFAAAPKKIKKKKSSDWASTSNEENVTGPFSAVESTCSNSVIEAQSSNVKNPPEEVQIFTEKNDIILPFPMILMDKMIKETDPNEILTIQGSSQTRQVPSVTQVLSETMPESSAIALAVWRKRKLAEVGEEGFKEFMREARSTGKDLHTCIETFLRGVDYNQVRVEPRVAGHWLSLKSMLKSVQNVRALESYVLHPRLKYKGFVDCVASHNGNLVLIDWKTSQRRKNTLESTYDDPVQIAAYAGAINADENYPFTVENALLVVAYPTGMPADPIYLNRHQLEAYWVVWLQRLQEFFRLKNVAAKQRQQG